MSIKIKELGIFEKNHEECKLIPVNFDWSDRQLWIDKIQYCNYYEIGSSNYSYDQIGVYNLIFNINAGDFRRSGRRGEDYVFVIQIEIEEWYRQEDSICKELHEGLSKYPILNVDEILTAFRQRHYYSNIYNIDFDLSKLTITNKEE